MWQRQYLAHLALWMFGLICCLNAMPIVELATALKYHMPNTDNCCTWPGVKCFNMTEPEEIIWDDYNLTGSFPQSVNGDFPYLKTLSLSNNRNISSYLDLFATQFSSFPVLQNLVLYGCTNINGALLPSILLLPSLERLDLSYTRVDGVFTFGFGNPLTNLKYLLVERASLSGIFPQWLNFVPNLINLKLGGNQLTGTLPANIATLTNLIELNVFNNLLTGTVPPEYASLTKLQVMRIGGNQLNGTLPDDFFANMPDLDTFEASNTNITGNLPSSLGTRSHFKQLILPNAQFYGPFPNFEGPLTYLDVTGNAFTGTVPDFIQQKVNLQTLTLVGTNFTGTLPPLASLTKLEVLSLANTQIYGPIPKIGSPTLTVVKLSNTLLSGCWSQDDLTVVTCAANNTQLCCAPEACLPLESICMPGDTTFSEPIVLTTIVFTENTTVTLTPGATITVTSKDCIEFNGKLIVEIDYAKLNLTLEELILMYYTCRNSTFDEVEFRQTNQPACLTDVPQIQYSPSQLSIVLPKNNQCGPNDSFPGWAIAVIVIGGLILVAGVLLLALYYSPMRKKVFPYAKRK